MSYRISTDQIELRQIRNITKNVMYIILATKYRRQSQWIKPINVQIEDNITDFFFLKNSITLSFTRAIQLNPNLKKRKKKELV